MTKDEIKAAAAKMHESMQQQPGYAYNPSITDSIIEAGVVPDGVVIMSMGPQVAKLEGGDVVTYTNGKETRRMPASTDRCKELMAYAVTAARLSVKVGA